MTAPAVACKTGAVLCKRSSGLHLPAHEPVQTLQTLLQPFLTQKKEHGCISSQALKCLKVVESLTTMKLQ